MATISYIFCLLTSDAALQATENSTDAFQKRILPILEENCFGCHGYGESEGSVSLDQFASVDDAIADRDLWLRALKMLRAGLMPPPDSSSLQADSRQELQAWIKDEVFCFEPGNPDPGRATLRRLNRIEYRYTVRDLLGIDYDTSEHFPPDDSGLGYDNLGEVLKVSPLHLEKYIAAAREIANKAVDQASRKKNANSKLPDLRFSRKGVFQDPNQYQELLEEILEPIASRAFRRPVEVQLLNRIVQFGIGQATAQGSGFHAALTDSLVAILTSPRFLYRLEQLEPDADSLRPRVDEFSLATRLSYFLWSTLPDEELFELAKRNELRSELPQQIERMLDDPKWERFVEQFAGQWLAARDINHKFVDISDVLRRDDPPNPRLIELRSLLHQIHKVPEKERSEEDKLALESLGKEYEELTAKYRDIDTHHYYALRPLMRQETELHFAHVIREDRSLLEFINCDYAFLNERLAGHYGIEGVEGKEMRKVMLPAGSPRGGVLTQGTMLVTTSNPTRTSPVKRGVYVLDKILGVPPAPPPDDIPNLPDERFPSSTETPSLRESLAKHREDPLCSSCHDRMDPIGLAFENFNALGAWRLAERGTDIDPGGELITGKSFKNVQELKAILVSEHKLDFYRCLTENMLTFAIGRGLEYYDVQTVDGIVEALVANEGSARVLIEGIVNSAPFQQRRRETSTGKKPAIAHQDSPALR